MTVFSTIFRDSLAPELDGYTGGKGVSTAFQKVVSQKVSVHDTTLVSALRLKKTGPSFIKASVSELRR